jgi:Oxygen-sensitive ribonucleoside-triphosphate reductase
MVTNVIKRDNQTVEFDANRIYHAIRLAQDAVKSKNENFELIADEDLMRVTDQVVQKLNSYNESTITINVIQHEVEFMLMDFGYNELAQEYISYRYTRDRARETNSYLITTIADLTLRDAADNDLKRENANINGDGSMGIMLRYGSEASKRFTHLMLLRPEISKAHLDGSIHIHDLDFYPLCLNCVQIDLGKLFENGFNTGFGHLREPSAIQTAAALAAIAIQSSQNDMFGGQSIAKFDYDLAPYISKTFAKHVLDIIETFYYVEDEDIADFPLYKEIKHFFKVYTGSVLTEECLVDCYDHISSMPNIEQAKSGDIKKYVVHDTEFDMAYSLRKVFKLAHKRTNKSTYQAMESFVHNMNTLNSRAGSQVPFSSVNYGTCTTPEGRMLISNLLYALDAGLGHVK